ncbi:8-amino-7-oxononanoate synthase [bacterium]|nr:8-amino-7-oxononanoate synthase [bacterium]
MSDWISFFDSKLKAARDKTQLRRLTIFDNAQAGYLISGETRYLNLSSNDYLGFTTDPFSREDINVLSEILPVGAGASRLVTGTLALHSELERLLAKWKKVPAALVFPSGFQTNVGLLSALGRRGDAIYGDKLNHASLHDGCRLSEAALHRYQHLDLNDLEKQLKAQSKGKRIIVTDGVFSMDGDIPPLPELNQLALKYDALLIVDEAHASGVLGAKGAGAWAHYRLKWQPHVVLMGTLSKAVGAQGGFVCASEQVIDYLINFSRSFIYTTGLSPLMAGIAHANICRIQNEPERIKALRKAIKTMRTALKKSGLDIPDGVTPIIPVLLGDNERTIECAKRLKEEGIIASAIRPPTVPEGTARLRISVSAAHDPEDLKRAAKAIALAANES